MTRAERDALVLEWLPLAERMVKHTMRHRRGKLVGYRDDLVQEARLALIRAVERYDPKKGVPLGPWIAMVLRRDLFEARYVLPGVVRPPRHQQTGLFSEQPSTSLDADPHGVGALLSRLPAPELGRPGARADAQHALTALHRALEAAGPAAASPVAGVAPALVWARVVLDGERQADVADELGVTRQRVNQVVHQVGRVLERLAEGWRAEAA